MQDVKWLKKQGVSDGAYKAIFTAPVENYPARLRNLIRLHSDRIRDGRNLNLKEWRAYAAIEDAYDIPFNQTTPTIVRSILAQNLNTEDTLKALAQWGLAEDAMFKKVELDGGKIGYIPNTPVIYNIFIPIVRAYANIRLASIFNERNQSPFLPYNPLKRTFRNQVLCEIMTDIVNTISTWYGYPSVLRQTILHMLKYGLAVTFPREEWHVEYSVSDNGTEKGDVETVKEGIRYIHPHPTRMGYDLRYPLTSLNSDTGTEWLFHWDVQTYGQILDSRNYWNRDKIFAGTNWFESPLAGNYFKEYYPCVMKFPVQGCGPASREDKLAWYSSGNRDQAVFLTHFFEKIVPRQYGLGNYNYPVWHRFVYAGDDTVIWCAPCAYSPCWMMGYDFDENAGRTPSLALELIPWQDSLGNALSQINLTARQNLMNVTFYDTNMVDRKDVARLENKGEERYRQMMFLPFDSMKWNRQGISAKEAFVTVQLAKTQINELLQTIPVTLNIMERVLQISAQEAGAAASHQQSKEEVQRTGNASNNRRNLTASHVDEGIDAWKRQLRDASLNYFDPDLTAEVSAEIPDLDKHLEELGFHVDSRGEDKVVVKGHKKALLRLEDFAASNQGPDRPNDVQVAQVLFQVIGVIAQNQQLNSELGVKAIAKILEQAALLAGAPKDFKLPLDPNSKGQLSPALMQALQQLQQTIMQSVAENVAKPAAQEVAKVQQEVTQQQQVIDQLKKIYEIAAQTQDKNAIKAADAKQKMALREAETRERLKLERMKTEAAIQRENAKTGAVITHKRAQIGADIQHKRLAAFSQQPEAEAEPKPVIPYGEAPEQIKRQLERKADLEPATTPTYLEKKAPKPTAAKPAKKPNAGA